MNSGNLAEVLGPWAQGLAPFYRLQAAALKLAILRGDIVSGSRLPAERQRAQQLAARRTTVVAAYDLLRQDGWVERRIGSDTWVCPVAGTHAAQHRNQLAGGLARGHFDLGDGYSPLGWSALRQASANRYTSAGLPTAPEGPDTAERYRSPVQ